MGRKYYRGQVNSKGQFYIYEEGCLDQLIWDIIVALAVVGIILWFLKLLGSILPLILSVIVLCLATIFIQNGIKSDDTPTVIGGLIAAVIAIIILVNYFN